jgi:hypothetical protein
MFHILTGLPLFWRCDCCCINANSGHYQNQGPSKKPKVCMHFCSMKKLKAVYVVFFSVRIIGRGGCVSFSFRYLFQRWYTEKNHKIVPITNVANQEYMEQKLKIGKYK